MWRRTSARISSGVTVGRYPWSDSPRCGGCAASGVRLLRLVVVEIVVVVLVVTLVGEEAVRLREREHLVDVGADRVVRDAFVQGVPDLFGRCHGDLLDARQRR